MPCGSSANSCTTDTNSGFSSDQEDMYWNYMDYGDFDCYAAFTAGQSDRMHFFIDGTRRSLLDSKGCLNPCSSSITAGFTASTLVVNLGGTVNFTNTTNGASSYEWLIDGTPFATSTNASYTFNTEGLFDISLVANNSDPNCREVYTLSIEVICPVVASFVSSSTLVAPGTVVFFNSTSSNATQFTWLLDGLPVGNANSLNYTFSSLGNYDIQLIAGNGLCQDTSALSVITVADGGLSQTGLPVWPMTSSNDPTIHSIDWRDDPPIVDVIANNGALNAGQTGAAFDACGNLVFYAIHTGSSDPNHLYLYQPNGDQLLSHSTANGPGFNAVRGGHEIQVIRVPETINEWFIIYNKWSSDFGSPINNAAYNLAHQLYARVRYENETLTVLQRDVTLTDNAGIAHRYNDGKAVSRTVNGDLNRHYLYACRRIANNGNLSIDRFIISNSGISFDANTGTVAAGWWSLTGAGSPMELSPTEDKIAIINRNQSANYADVVVFDAQDFNNSNIEIIRDGSLQLVPDGTSNDLSSELPYSAPIQTVASDPNLNLRFLRNFERKINGLEFSPNGRFLYLIGGGFVAGSTSNLTYLAQIDLETNPLEVRLQIQWPPFGNYNNNTGGGCTYNSSGCLENYNSISYIESSFDGKLYFTKRTDNILYVIPDPNNIMPQNLVPSDVDLSTPQYPNIIMAGAGLPVPDQIDGFNYLNFTHQEVAFVVNKEDCEGQCDQPYEIQLFHNGQLTQTFEAIKCPDTLRFCADTSWVYDIFEPGLGITYNGAIDHGEVIYPDQRDRFDFVDLQACTEICGNGIDDDNDGLIDCDDPDIDDPCCCDDPPTLELGPDVVMCDNGIVYLDAGDDFVSYRWQDGSIEKDYTAWNPGTYWVEVSDTCGGIQRDTVSIIVDPISVLDIGPDEQICQGGTINLFADGFDQYQWTPSDYLTCDTCSLVTISPDSTITYVLVASTDLGCISVDSITIEVVDALLEIIDSSYLCPGASTQVFGQTVTTPGIYTQYVTTIGLCDSLIGIEVLATDTTLVFEEIELCDGDSIELFGSLMVNAAGEYFQVFTGENGCDSTQVYEVALVVVDDVFETQSICQGDSIQLFGQWVANAGDYSQIFTGLNGCEFLNTISLSVLDTSFSTEVLSICENESILIFGQMESDAGFYSQTFSNVLGCDSTHQIELQVLDTVLVYEERIICDGDSSIIFGQPITSSGIYTQSFLTANGCDSTNAISLLVLDALEVEAEVEPTCPNDSTGSISLLANGGLPPYQIQWGHTSEDAYFVDQLPTGSYSLALIDANGCEYSALVEVPSAPNPTLSWIIDPVTCFGADDGGLVIEAISSDLTYSWDGENFVSNTSFVNIPAGEHLLTIQDEFGCLYEERILIPEPPLLLAVLPEQLELILGEELVLLPNVNTNAPLTYAWSPEEGLSCSDCPAPVASPHRSTTYTLVVTDEAGCTAEAQVRINVSQLRRVFIPNVFSPNGDGLNERFTVFSDESVASIPQFLVFDRWGELVYEGVEVQPNNLTQGWNGTFRGEEMDPGIFVYMIKVAFVDGHQEVYSGDVALVR
ncbi:MAG: gliding motility-associated C-terminal domain-containing protein [Bacteroidota bacterium]